MSSAADGASCSRRMSVAGAERDASTRRTRHVVSVVSGVRRGMLSHRTGVTGVTGVTRVTRVTGMHGGMARGRMGHARAAAAIMRMLSVDGAGTGAGAETWPAPSSSSSVGIVLHLVCHFLHEFRFDVAHAKPFPHSHLHFSPA